MRVAFAKKLTEKAKSVDVRISRPRSTRSTDMKHILLIDDDPNLLDSVRRFLRRRRNEWELTTTSIGSEALKIVREKAVHLVITDLLMPETEGIEIVRTLHRDHPDVKIVAMSGSAMQGDLDVLGMARSFGADATLEKPFRSEELISVIESLLEGPSHEEGSSGD